MPSEISETDLFNDEAPQKQRVVSVLLPLGIPGPYDYSVPDTLSVGTGDYVTVPLGPREVLGVVWGEGSGEVGHNRLKAIIDKLDAPPMTYALRQFVDWISVYTLSPPGAVLRLAVRVPGALEPAGTRTVYRLGGPPPQRMTPGREKVLALAQDGFARTTRELADEAGVSAAVVRGLIDAGTFEAVELPADAPFETPDLDRDGAALSEDQKFAAEQLRARIEQGGFSAQLLDGVTG
ncbi:MAG: primosomal protein N', partial [Parvibaculum sp.]|nr:primosomal protein N' [Parvibaculum sp.]